ncbi:heme-binding domain-containing protein [Larkinella rosea]|uniref:Cytochrome C n=1 Tax=Larkinella rosea TaxID=2025312 RepID=A0A3P1BNA7_9BACT|nr:heme-binding domain-containing protein [Larkinella rosea]RRB02296.1 cytochrome C [Larkinella rosea]
MMKKVLIGIAVLLIGIQFIRPDKNEGSADSPQDITHAVQVPEPVMQTLKVACYDCHSNHTKYPWYANISPVSLWLANHVNEGKSELNFSSFAAYDKKRMDHKLEEIGEEVEEGHMPLPAYTMLHHDAELSESQKQLLVEWAKTERTRLGYVPEK